MGARDSRVGRVTGMARRRLPTPGVPGTRRGRSDPPLVTARADSRRSQIPRPPGRRGGRHGLPAARLWLAAASLVLGTIQAARGQNDPHVGYVYPAGAQVGTQVSAVLGGQHLDEPLEVLVTGTGVRATIGKHSKPLSQREVFQLRDKVNQVRDKLAAEGKRVDLRNRRGAMAEFLKLIQEMGVTEEDLERLEEYQRRRMDEKRQLNPALEEEVRIELQVDATAPPGRRELRLKTARGISNPLAFFVDIYPERAEREPNDSQASESLIDKLPAIFNGQIMPGDVDRFRVPARKGDRLAVVVRARALVPYLADAVPGWFQATVALYDPAGREVAYADDDFFRPDPILFYRIPQEGDYQVEIRDAIYRGREDFVYRVTVGAIPVLTHVFPLGGRAGESTEVGVYGWNLPVKSVTFDATQLEPGLYPLAVAQRKLVSNAVDFAVDTLPETIEQEPNNHLDTAQPLQPPIIVNGRIDAPGDWDVYRFDGRAGGHVFAEVLARRLDSPLDSLLTVTDAAGHLLAMNDDVADPGAGLLTHQADSQLQVALPSDGAYFLHIGDTQKKGGAAYAYRLRLSARRPDFALRIVPATISARPGSTVVVTVHALRHDDFDQDIRLSLQDPPPGFTLSGGWVPADQINVPVTLTVPAQAREEPYRLHLVGHADVRGRELVRAAVPAEDMMQAFFYRHLVPATELVVYVSGKAPPRAALLANPAPVTPEHLLKIPRGGLVRYRLALPARPSLDDVKVELSDPPEGLSLVRVIPAAGAMVLLISADAEKVKLGLQGNLIFNVFVERPATGRKGGPGGKRRVPLGSFPAVPFEVVAREA